MKLGAKRPFRFSAHPAEKFSFLDKTLLLEAGIFSHRLASPKIREGLHGFHFIMYTFGESVTTYLSPFSAIFCLLFLTKPFSYGESHCRSVGCIVDGCPPGMALTEVDIQPQMTRRRPVRARSLRQETKRTESKFNLAPSLASRWARQLP